MLALICILMMLIGPMNTQVNSLVTQNTQLIGQYTVMGQSLLLVSISFERPDTPQYYWGSSLDCYNLSSYCTPGIWDHRLLDRHCCCNDVNKLSQSGRGLKRQMVCDVSSHDVQVPPTVRSFVELSVHTTPCCILYRHREWRTIPFELGLGSSDMCNYASFHRKSIIRLPNHEEKEERPRRRLIKSNGFLEQTLKPVESR
jgi:hypothetical protein